ncbi:MULTISPECIES: thiamine pyrophosphate-dependent dehydrogenase E1 component subunit alpha [Bacillus amyloliquefaciens group]|uniref:thiamine pyrophosphate-dependent dehydrogenase E1 component subunit alpha n=1 Tax=Bacillus amyloliquefaciens group TaxID=1938374 RepID=UPI00024169D8|nr:MULTISPECIES: thiamine pyrophosphate-dependent dehydrogenase E1 component subunit alpha [Bacillus amyloliquefaciens group]AGF27143.1 3-methyl-2-oxobutanoate dehydrogenase subunit alpha [Bacillus amyloliquefaciens IT-45]AMP31256.1 2-oxoisovalerate dehydrogenase [Bacillus amyloliquefaciens]ERK82129.1 2-oxoisovalerate dehydrogenase subunit alpha [Bacillus amyloliquefaciens UASWS BA1]MBH5315492.1 thiamine pyrophosphate-dependent dehydrogenase E1 component subunit alpha [Bacillus velezensis]MDQ1
MTTNRHQALGLSDEEAIEMYRTMLLARKIDERMWLLNRSGKIPFVISCQGQEAAQVGAAYALNRDTDYVLPYYRDMGVVLAFGMTAKDLMMSGFAKAADPNSGGRQMPGHFGQKENRIVTGSSPVTTQVPHAVGIALAGRMDKKDIVSFVTFGEGSSNQGDFHEGANFAAVYKLPVIFMCENNKYAISVPYDKQVACENISDRAAGYGMPGVTVDGNDLLEVYRAVKEARERASKGEGPTLIETVSYRLTPHSSDDDDSSYREREEVEEAKKQDPLLLYKAYLQEAGLLGEEEEKAMLDDIMAIVNEATDEAEKAPYASPESTLDHVYAK